MPKSTRVALGFWRRRESLRGVRELFAVSHLARMLGAR